MRRSARLQGTKRNYNQLNARGFDDEDKSASKKKKNSKKEDEDYDDEIEIDENEEEIVAPKAKKPKTDKKTTKSKAKKEEKKKEDGNVINLDSSSPSSVLPILKQFSSSVVDLDANSPASMPNLFQILENGKIQQSKKNIIVENQQSLVENKKNIKFEEEKPQKHVEILSPKQQTHVNTAPVLQKIEQKIENQAAQVVPAIKQDKKPQIPKIENKIENQAAQMIPTIKQDKMPSIPKIENKTENQPNQVIPTIKEDKKPLIPKINQKIENQPPQVIPAIKEDKKPSIHSQEVEKPPIHSQEAENPPILQENSTFDEQTNEIPENEAKNEDKPPIDNSDDEDWVNSEEDDDDEDPNLRNEREEQVNLELKKEVEKKAKTIPQEDLLLGTDGKDNSVYLEPTVVAVMKKHQIEGLKFVWRHIVQLDNAGDRGCILAHSMGLGKTLQMVIFVHTFLRLGIGQKVLVVCPKSTLLNWSDEFKKWTKICGIKPIRPFCFKDQQSTSNKTFEIQAWQHLDRSVFIISFELLTRLILPEYRNKAHQEYGELMDLATTVFVNPGPDMLIVDEGQNIKNKKTKRSQALCSIRTRNRVVLTGTPLQNHLMEFFSMIDFVREGYWKQEHFNDYFRNPIELGMTKDADDDLVKTMRKRSYILGEHVKNIMDRRDMRFLAQQLPPKYEFLVFLKPTNFQQSIYKHFIDFYQQNFCGEDDNILYFTCMLHKIINHPDLLIKYVERKAGEIHNGNKGRKERIKQLLSNLNYDENSKSQEHEKLFNDDDDEDQIEETQEETNDDETQEVETKPEKKDDFDDLLNMNPLDLSKNNKERMKQLTSGPNSKKNHSKAPSIFSFANETPQTQKNQTPLTINSKNKKKKTPKTPKSPFGSSVEEEEVEEEEKDLEVDELFMSGASRVEAERDRRERLKSLLKSFKNAVGWAQKICTKKYVQKSIEFSTKIQFVAELIQRCCYDIVDQSDCEKILIFSQFVETLDVIQDCLQAHEFRKPDGTSEKIKDFEFLRIEGSMTAKMRHTAIKKFNNLNNLRNKILLISTKAGGLGINLTAATRVILFDVTWDPTWIKQAIFRAYRIGQKKSVYCYHLIGHHTVEESIYKRCLKKNWMFAKCVDDVSAERKLTAKDMDIHEFDNDVDDSMSIFDPDNENNRIDMIQKDTRFLNQMYKAKQREFQINRRLSGEGAEQDISASFNFDYDSIREITESDSLFVDEAHEKISQQEKSEAMNEYQHDMENELAEVKARLESEFFLYTSPLNASTLSFIPGDSDPATYNPNNQPLRRREVTSLRSFLSELSQIDKLTMYLSERNLDVYSPQVREFIKEIFTRHNVTVADLNETFVDVNGDAEDGGSSSSKKKKKMKSTKKYSGFMKKKKKYG